MSIAIASGTRVRVGRKLSDGLPVDLSHSLDLEVNLGVSRGPPVHQPLSKRTRAVRANRQVLWRIVAMGISAFRWCGIVSRSFLAVVCQPRWATYSRVAPGLWIGRVLWAVHVRVDGMERVRAMTSG